MTRGTRSDIGLLRYGLVPTVRKPYVDPHYRNWGADIPQSILKERSQRMNKLMRSPLDAPDAFQWLCRKPELADFEDVEAYLSRVPLVLEKNELHRFETINDVRMRAWFLGLANRRTRIADDINLRDAKHAAADKCSQPSDFY